MQAKGAPVRYQLEANAAGALYGVSPAILLSIAEIESSFGANTGPSSAGAQGPMQFLPSTWALPGIGNGGDINDVHDAMFAAARYLKKSGYKSSDPAAVRKSIFAYNHSDSYVNSVIEGAKKYGYKPGRLVGTIGTGSSPTSTDVPLLPDAVAGPVNAAADGLELAGKVVSAIFDPSTYLRLGKGFLGYTLITVGTGALVFIVANRVSGGQAGENVKGAVSTVVTKGKL